MAWYLNVMSLLAQAAPAAAAAANDAAPAAAAGAEGLSGTVQLIIAAAILVGSFVGGAVLARSLRARTRFSPGSGAVLGRGQPAICYFGWPPKRGIDLSGGVVLVYEVDTGLAKRRCMPTAIQRINTQLNAEGGEKLEARPEGNNQIEIAVPDGVDQKKVEQRSGPARLRRPGAASRVQPAQRRQDGPGLSRRCFGTKRSGHEQADRRRSASGSIRAASRN